MTATVQALIEALRLELQQYGEMLALLDRQQELVISRAAGELVDSITVINSQSTAIHKARASREQARKALAASLHQPEDAAFNALIPAVHADVRPLLGALVDENNALLIRVQQRARQNHMMLSRSLELMRKLVQSLLPSNRTTVYTDGGELLPDAVPTKSLYEAVG